MKDIIINKKSYSTYKDFYEDIVIKLSANRFIDWKDEKNLNYNADIFEEFLWYCHKDNIHFIFKNFNLEKIKNYKNYDNYEWNIIIEVFQDFVKKYPNNTLEFVNEE